MGCVLVCFFGGFNVCLVIMSYIYYEGWLCVGFGVLVY